MKKNIHLAIALVFALLLLSFPAYAAGKMTVGQENFHVIDSYNIYGYVFAKVENTGDKPVEFSAGLLEIYDENGDTLTSTDYMYCYPKTLQPGEVGYIYASDGIDTVDSLEKVDDYMLTVTGKSGDAEIIRYPTVGDFQEDVQVSKYSTYNYVIAEITNNTEETVYSMNVVIALLDDQDNILYLAHNDFYMSTGINAGSTITYRDSISDSFYEAWEREGVKPAHVDVIAYSEVESF